MNFSTYSSYVRRAYPTPQDGLQELHRLGIYNLDVLEAELEAWPLNQYQKFTESYGVHIGSIVVMADLAKNDAVLARTEIFRFKKLIDSATLQRVEHIMVVPMVCTPVCIDDRLFAREQIVYAMNELVPYAKAAGITLTLENYSEFLRPYSTVEDMHYLLSNIPGLKFTLDTGNFHCVGIDVIDAYNSLSEHMVHVHVKDWKEDVFGSVIRPNLPALEGCAVGSGILPIKEFLTKIKQNHYDGTLLVEINNSQLTAADIRQSVSFIKECVL